MKKSFFIIEIIAFVAIFITVEIFVPENVFAGYLDPGSGSTFMQVIIASITAVRRFFRRLIGKKD